MTEKRSFRQSLAYVVATGALSGKSPVAPGTAGTIVALALAFVFRQAIPWTGTIFGSIVIASLATALGVFVIDVLLKSGCYGEDSKDPQEIVIDEFAGFFLTIVVAGTSPADLLYCFLLFRVFDMSKPPPIKRIENLPGAWGIMLDDIGAGVYAIICFLVLKQFL